MIIDMLPTVRDSLLSPTGGMRDCRYRDASSSLAGYSSVDKTLLRKFRRDHDVFFIHL